MKTAVRLFAYLMILLFPIACGETKKPERLEARIDPWVIIGNDLHITFTMPMAEEDKLESTSPPDIAIDPPLRGSFSWASPTLLVFSPEKDAIKIGVSYTVTIRNAVPLKGKAFGIENREIGRFMGRYFEMAGKAADWPVSKGSPRLVDYIGWHTGYIGQGGLLLLYDQPILPEKLSGLVKAAAAGRPLTVSLSRPAADDISFNSELNADYIVSVKIADLPASGTTVLIRSPSFQEGGSIQYREWEFTVNRDFTCDLITISGWEPGRDIPDEEDETGENADTEMRFPRIFKKKWRLSFNNPVSFEEMQAALQIESPEGKQIDSYIAGLDYSTFEIEVTAPPGRRIRLSLADMVDSLGNPLNDKPAVSDTAPDLPPELHLPRSPLVIESKGNSLPLKFLNISKLTIRYQIISSPVDYIALLNKPLDNIVLQTARTKTITLKKEEYPMNEFHHIDVPLEAVSTFQLVSITAAEAGSEARRVREHKILVHSSDIAITSKVSKDGVFVWVTSIAAPAALKGAAVVLYNVAGETLAQAVTDSSGTALLKAADIMNGDALQRTLFVSASWGKAVGFSRLEETELASAWQFHLPKKTAAERLGAVIFSDRGVYRSGDTVHLKLFIDRNAAASNDVSVLIRDSRGRAAYDAVLPLDEFAGAALDFPVTANAPLGEYTVYANKGNARCIYSFQVEEYRTPRFVVTVSGQREEWRNDERNYGRIKAEYTKGGVLAGRTVSWRVFRKRIPFTAAKFPGYVFGLESSSDELNENVADGEGRLNEAGELTIDFSISSPVADSLMLYVLQGTVTDLDRETYSGSYSALVHPSSLYAGVKPPSRTIISSGDDIIVPIVVVDRNGNPVPDVKVVVRLEEIEYHTNVRLINFNMTRMDTREEYARVNRAVIVSQKAPVQCRINVPKAGRYQLVCDIIDKENRPMCSGFTFTVTGDQPAPWPRYDKEQIEILTDKTRYREGDTASIVTMTPYQNALGLLTLEKDGVIVYKKTFTIAQNTPAIQFPVKAEYVPNVYASVIIVRGREHYEKDASGFETGAPGFKIGYAAINVEPSSRRLSLSITPSSRIVRPGGNFTVSLECVDRDKKPVPGQVTLAVVDEAVLSLTGFQFPDPLRQMLPLTQLGVRTGSNLLDLPHSRRSRHETLFEGGGDDLSGYVEPAKVLRNLFMSTAYWNPSILLDQNGRASVQVTLPDNITSYRIMGVVTDIQQRMGSASGRITSKKPLMIMPVLPRFVREGDRFTLEARVFNETGAAGSAVVKAVLKGLRPDTSSLEQKKSIGAFSDEFFRFPATVTAKDMISVRFSAVLGSSSDTAEYSIPVLESITERKTVHAAIVQPGKTAAVDFDVPAGFLPGSLRLELSASANAVSQLADAVSYIMHYPHGCIEQTTSTAYPLIILKDLFKETGVSIDEARLREYTEAGIKRITTFLTPSGGLAYWPGENQPHPYGTGFGAMALVEARHQGYTVPPDVLAKLGDYMERLFSRTPVKKGINAYGDADADTLALYAAVLGRMNRAIGGFIDALWNNSERLSAFGLSFLAVAVKESNGSRELLGKILAALRSRIKEYNDDAYVAEYRDEGRYSLGSVVRSQGAALYALSISGTDNVLAFKLLSGLLKKRRREGFWGGTQETIFAIMGIHRYAASSAISMRSEFTFTVNGRDITSQEFTNETQRSAHLILSEDRLGTIGGKIACTFRNTGSRPLITSTRLVWHVKLDPDSFPSAAHGFSIERSWEKADGKKLDPRNIPLGGLIRIRLKVKADGKASYCAVDDQLPAGLEPLNTQLQTTERIDIRQLSLTAQKTLPLVSYSEVRDSRVFFYVNAVEAGEYEFVYFARPTVAGVFLAPPARVEPMYDLEHYASTGIETVTIKK